MMTPEQKRLSIVYANTNFPKQGSKVVKQVKKTIRNGKLKH